MRLLARTSTGQFSFTKDHIGDDKIPPYAILSHTWQHNQEVTNTDVLNDSGKHKAGWDKIRFCAQQAESDGLHYVWVDTCCINKADPTELQDAINSMFRWYQNAEQCYVYLWDVSADDDSDEVDWVTAFRKSRWFTRGWTLQELIAPRTVNFFSREGKHLGNKRTLEQLIHEITGIPVSALQNSPLTKFSLDERMSWMRKRHTTRKEDKVYSLLGMFGIFLAPIYGEGEQYARNRFRRELDAVSRPVSVHQDEAIKDTAKPVQAPWLVPLTRPRSFVGREAQLAQLRAHLLCHYGERLAIYGLGGCGKTALALEFAHWTKEHDSLRAVFWVPAISRESFEQAYHEIAKLLCLPSIEDNKTDVKRLVKARLDDENFGPWLLIIDNADDANILFGNNQEDSSAAGLISDLPRSSKGSIIFTTRTRAVAIKLAENNVLALGEFECVEAIEILNTRLLLEHQHQLTDSDIVHEFLEMLTFHALAIIQAIAFINRNDLTLSDYIGLYRNSESDAIELLSEEFEDQSRYREATKSVATTWSISFEQIQQQDKIAAEYLFFMACIANNDIDPALFPLWYTQMEHTKAIGTLKAYAFITERHPQADVLPGKRQKAPKRFDVHPLIHLAIRSFLKACGKWNFYVGTTLTRFIETIPHGKHVEHEHWTLHWHHAVHLIELQETHEMRDRLGLLGWIELCERALGRYQAAEKACRQNFEQRRRLFGEENLDTLKSMANLGQILNHQEEWAKAENILEETFVLMEKSLGEDDPHTLTVRGDLAMAMLGQSKVLEAEKVFRGLLILWHRKGYGNKHVDILATVHNLGVALSTRGEYANAEQCLRENLASYKEVLGVAHKDTLTGMSVLGATLNRQSKYSETENVHREELALRIEVMVEGHPDTLRCMRRLGFALAAQKKYTEGEQLLRDALVISERMQGRASRSTLHIRHVLAETLREQMKYDESFEIVSENITIQEEMLGKNHLNTIESVSFLAALAHDQMLYEDALPLYERAVTGYQGTLGPDHVSFKRCLDNYTWIQRVVEEDKLAAAAKAERATTDAAEDQRLLEHQVFDTNDMVIRPRERWREKMKKWRR